MKKIVELLIKQADLELEELGVDTVSLVDSPAIGYEWFAFNSVQEFVEPRAGETEAEFIGRCIPKLLKEGYDQDQAAAICYTYWKKGFTKQECTCSVSNEFKSDEDLDIDEVADMFLEYFESVGEEHDPKYTTYISAEDFAEEGTTVSAVADAIKALDILKGKSDSNQQLQTVFKYEGPLDNRTRKLCRGLLQLSRSKVFTADDIRDMAANSSFIREQVIPKAGTNASNYNLFRYAAGANCRHHWAEYKMFKDTITGKTLFIKTGYTTTKGKDHGVGEGNMGGYTSQSALDRAKQWAAMNFATMDEDKKIVVAPAMVPEILIKRLDHEGREYFVYFSKDTIRDIAEKFFKKNYHNNTDVNHDGEVTTNNTLLESWIVEDPEKDKAAVYGFNVPAGTWMLSMKINDEETWKKIKNGELKGYSISGNFIELAK